MKENNSKSNQSPLLSGGAGGRLIQTINLQRAFTTEEVRTIALSGVNIDINDGEFVAVMGPSGCGKTTLLNILGLLDAPTEGEYLLDGQNVSHLSEPQRDRLRKGLIGFVFQSFNLIEDLTVEENIELPLLYMRLPKAERRQRVHVQHNKGSICTCYGAHRSYFCKGHDIQYLFRL